MNLLKVKLVELQQIECGKTKIFGLNQNSRGHLDEYVYIKVETLSEQTFDLKLIHFVL